MTAPPQASETTDPAFERVFRAEYPRVVAIATRVLGDGGRAEDVAQEAFLALHRRRRGGGGGGGRAQQLLTAPSTSYAVSSAAAAANAWP
jgi:DNA-directed RNA polymerase specialized sigma24 family protein